MNEEVNTTQEADDDEEVVLERIIPEEEDNTPPPDRFERIQPIFEHLKVDKVEINQEELREKFDRLW